MKKSAPEVGSVSPAKRMRSLPGDHDHTPMVPSAGPTPRVWPVLTSISTSCEWMQLSVVMREASLAPSGEHAPLARGKVDDKHLAAHVVHPAAVVLLVVQAAGDPHFRGAAFGEGLLVRVGWVEIGGIRD